MMDIPIINEYQLKAAETISGIDIESQIAEAITRSRNVKNGTDLMQFLELEFSRYEGLLHFLPSTSIVSRLKSLPAQFANLPLYFRQESNTHEGQAGFAGISNAGFARECDKAREIVRQVLLRLLQLAHNLPGHETRKVLTYARQKQIHYGLAEVFATRSTPNHKRSRISQVTQIANVDFSESQKSYNSSDPKSADKVEILGNEERSRWNELHMLLVGFGMRDCSLNDFHMLLQSKQGIITFDKKVRKAELGYIFIKLIQAQLYKFDHQKLMFSILGKDGSHMNYSYIKARSGGYQLLESDVSLVVKSIVKAIDRLHEES